MESSLKKFQEESMQHVTSEIFSTVPKKNYLSLYHDDQTDYQRVVDWLDFQKKDVARATQTPTESVRYDEKMPKELKERIDEWANLLQLVAQHFKDERKTLLWFKMPNHLLGNVSPRDMIRLGRYKKLLKFVVVALNENKKD